MVSTFTTNLALEKQAAGENTDTWGSKINDVLDLLDDAIAGRLNKSVAGSSNVTLTAAEARNAWHEYNGTLTGNINVIVPTTEKLYYVFNNTAGAFTLTVKTSAGSGIVVTQGEKVILYADATDVIEATDTFPDPMTTRGDIIFRNATVPARLAVGAANTALTSDGTDPAWGSITGPYIVLGSDAQGDLILRGASDYARLAIGAADTVLGSNGTTASWAKVDGPNIAMGSDAQGDVLYYNGTTYVRLGPGTSGEFLQTQGAAANPLWAALSQATQAAIEAETNENTYIPPNLARHAPGDAKVWVKWEQTGAHGILASHNMTSVTDGGATGDTDHLWNTDFSGIEYIVVEGSEDSRQTRPVPATFLVGGVTTISRQATTATDVVHNSIAIFGDQ